MAFEMASTNLVLELSIIMLVFLGWRFMLAEAIGAPIMIATARSAVPDRFLPRRFWRSAESRPTKASLGRMEGHAAMDMSVSEGGSIWQRMISEQGLTAISHYFVMDWARSGWISSAAC